MMKTHKSWIYYFGFLLSTSSFATSTPAFYKCVGKIGGEWNYGRAPNACNASSFGDDKVVNSDFAVAIFDDGVSRSQERQRYMEEVQAIVRDAAAYYLKKRKPTVTDAELQAWELAIMATASHESYASHYRRYTGGILKLMRGDSGHGHGLMQIDDRGHYQVINNGIAWNIITNLTYGMDIFYDGWRRAPQQSCVGSETNYVSRTRAAWSAYNGGPAQICRFTKKTSAWAANDTSFYQMLKNKSWMNYVSRPLPTASINVPCLIENQENCPSDPPQGEPPPPAGVVPGVLYELANGSDCVLTGQSLSCVSEHRDAICLHALADFPDTAAVKVDATAVADYTQSPFDRHTLCAQYDPTLFAVGSLLELKKSIYVRATPGGGKVGLVLTGDVVEVLDFEVRSHPNNDRYYKIRLGDTQGFIYAGTAANQTDWLVPSKATSTQAATLAGVGETIEIVNAAGVNVRSTPGGNLLTNIPVHTRVTVLSTTVRGSDNQIYYQVKYGSKSGYIYGGHLIPTDTTSSWYKRLREI